MISFGNQELHDEVLLTGARSIGLKVDWTQRNRFKAVAEKLDELAPTHLILRTPSTDLLSWARQKDLRVPPSFADSFTPRPRLRGWLDRLRARRLAKALNHPSIQYVGNHNIAAAEDLARIGVTPEKIIPWDWPRAPTPSDDPAKPPSLAAVKRPMRSWFTRVTCTRRAFLVRSIWVWPLGPQWSFQTTRCSWGTLTMAPIF